MMLQTPFFKAMGNWLKFAGFPFGDRMTVKPDGKREHDFGLGTGGVKSFANSQRRHDRWKQKREESSGYVDADHRFRRQGEGKAYTYKMFVEVAHAILRNGGRFGLIVPNGLYSDHGASALRKLLLDQCHWEWIFGFENREGIFDIHRSFKFNPVIVSKGGQTASIRTAFMRRQLADWEQAERFVTEYPRERVSQFSPKSLAILEIQSARDLDMLIKIYSNSVLLGDQGPDGWGIKYAQGDFNMTSDSKLFPPRPKWEEWGYRPDEYSRWIKGPWKPIEQLYAELGVEPLPDGECRCAQPPYGRLSIPRADIPAGVILSREATHYIHEGEIPTVTFTDGSGKPLKMKIVDENAETDEDEIRGQAVALPLYEGRMIGQFDFSQKGWVSGKGRSAVWTEISWVQKVIEPQYLMGEGVYQRDKLNAHLDLLGTEDRDLMAAEASRLADSREFAAWWLHRPEGMSIMDVTSATNARTMIASGTRMAPNGHSAPKLRCQFSPFVFSGIVNTLAWDSIVRLRTSGLHLLWAILEETPLPKASCAFPFVSHCSTSLNSANVLFAPDWLYVSAQKGTSIAWRSHWAVTHHERLRVLCSLEAIVAVLLGLTVDDLATVLSDTDYPKDVIGNKVFASQLNAKGLWRIDKNSPPEHRHTVLTLVAAKDLQAKIDSCGGDVWNGIEAFFHQNKGHGWMLPETVRLADYGLGHDSRATQQQPVRDCFGQRFYDWQVSQDPEESWRECHLHARNLLGPNGYQVLLDEIQGRSVSKSASPTKAPPKREEQQVFSETKNLPLFPD